MEGDTIRITKYGYVVITHAAYGMIEAVYVADIEHVNVVGMQDGTDELVLHMQEQEIVRIPHLACNDVMRMRTEIIKSRILWQMQRRADQERVSERSKT